MTAYFQIEVHEGRSEKQIIRVDHVRDIEQADKIQARLLAVHVDKVMLLSLQEDAMGYTVNEVMQERNLFGGPRRYSCPGLGHTVTVPDSE